MRAIVIGGSGQIGGWLLRALAERGHAATGTYATVPSAGLARLDATERAEAAAWLRAQDFDVIFYPAGFTWVDGCERDPARALASNLEEPWNLARVAADRGARFVYFSSDYVFDGRSGPYAEGDPAHPLNAYGRAKLDAEAALAGTLGASLLVVRTCWVFGPERQGKNFAYQLIRTLRAGRVLTCPSDQWSSPSYGPDVALAAVGLAESGRDGLFHVAGPEWIDRPSFARAIAAAFALDPGRIAAVPTAELGQGAPRPLRGGLRTPRLDGEWPGAMRPLAAALTNFRARLDAGEGWADPRTGP
ncbi:MAG TPA: SDR family oxidoreductase [Isosphaeraceae bacterium]|jgi:dTDP-4-dehydrorhamnose reductase